MRDCEHQVPNALIQMFSPRVKVKDLSRRAVLVIYKREGQDVKTRAEGAASVKDSETGGGVGASGGQQFGERRFSIAAYSRVSLLLFSNHHYDIINYIIASLALPTSW